MSDCQNLCVRCNKKGAINICSACKKARYCNTDCQAKHWKKHKKQCKKWTQQRKATRRTPTRTRPSSPVPVTMSRKGYMNVLKDAIEPGLEDNICIEIYSFVTGYKQTLRLKNEDSHKVLNIDIHTMSYYEQYAKQTQQKCKINPYSIHIVYNDEDPDFKETIDITLQHYNKTQRKQETLPLITLKKCDIKRKNKLLISAKNAAELVAHALRIFDLMKVGCNTIGISPNVTKDVGFKIETVKHARSMIHSLLMESPDLRWNATQNDPLGMQSLMDETMEMTFGKQHMDMMKKMTPFMNMFQ
eukprot:270125_1